MKRFREDEETEREREKEKDEKKKEKKSEKKNRKKINTTLVNGTRIALTCVTESN